MNFNIYDYKIKDIFMNYEYEDFTHSDMEDVLEYWQDVSQDPDFISKETGLDLYKVIQILETLQKRGDISGFEKVKVNQVDESKVLLFEDIVSPKIRKELRLDQLTKKSNDKNYFFDEKEIGKVYDAHIFEVKAMKVFYLPDLINIPLEVTIKGKDYFLSIVYLPDENIYYSGDKLDDLKNALGNNSKLFDEVTQQILDDHIPFDFWEVKNMQN
jgi:hypothetical protein